MDRLATLISLCRRAGKLKTGFDAVCEIAAAGEASMVLCASDLSEKSFSRLARELEYCRSGLAPRGIDRTMSELEPYVGRRTGILAICDGNFAVGIDNILNTSDITPHEKAALGGE